MGSSTYAQDDVETPTVKGTKDPSDVLKAENQKELLLSLIRDSYKRMATNRDEGYRAAQMLKVNGWLDDLTKLWEGGKLPNGM